MSEPVMEVVLRCEQCNKPFDKHSTLKRHGYYCRSKRTGRTIKARSCVSCAKAKARCDNTRPSCSRCSQKATECYYPSGSLKRLGVQTPQNDAIEIELLQTRSSYVATSSSIEKEAEAISNVDTTFANAIAFPDSDVMSFGTQYTDWNFPEVDFTDLLNPPIYDETIQLSSPGLSSLAEHSLNHEIPVQQTTHPPKLSIPAVPTIYNVRSLVERSQRVIRSQGIANMIFHTLKSFPVMILRHNTVPPFIHQLLISSDDEENDMESLNNSLSLVHMIGSKIPGSRKLFWKNVRLECERIREEHLSMNKWQLLAAVQALSIYILVRLQEGEMEYNNHDNLLLMTMIMVAKQTSRMDATCTVPYDPDLRTTWKNWIFLESRKRLALIYRVINLLVYFEPATMCVLQNDLILAPLPAKKQLWEASDEHIWKARSEEMSDAKDTFALATNGKLVMLEERHLSCNTEVLTYKSLSAGSPSPGNAGWEDWYSEMDGFGGLVMLVAASLTA